MKPPCFPNTTELSSSAKLNTYEYYFLYEGNSLVHIAMRKKEIPHEYRVRNGGHSWTYWRESLPVVLEFVSQAFHRY